MTFLDARLIGGIVICDTGEWSGSHDDAFTCMEGVFAGTYADLDETITSWCVWSPFTCDMAVHSSDP
jgi:hypothetical protein